MQNASNPRLQQLQQSVRRRHCPALLCSLCQEASLSDLWAGTMLSGLPDRAGPAVFCCKTLVKYSMKLCCSLHKVCMQEQLQSPTLVRRQGAAGTLRNLCLSAEVSLVTHLYESALPSVPPLQASQGAGPDSDDHVC